MGCAGFGPWRPYMAPVLKNDRVTAENHFQDTRHIELGLGNSGLAYEPGALLAVFTQQDPRAVAAFCERAKLDAESWVRIAPEQELDNGHSSSMEVSLAAWHLNRCFLQYYCSTAQLACRNLRWSLHRFSRPDLLQSLHRFIFKLSPNTSQCHSLS